MDVFCVVWFASESKLLGIRYARFDFSIEVS